jgi:hypothetical protein
VTSDREPYNVTLPNPTSPRRRVWRSLAVTAAALLLASGSADVTTTTPTAVPGDPIAHQACNAVNATWNEEHFADLTDAEVVMIGDVSALSSNVDIRVHGKALYDAYFQAADEFKHECGAGTEIDNQIEPQFEEFRGACLNARYI